MQTDRTTRLLLAAIASALWLHLLLPWLVPVAVADSPMRVTLDRPIEVHGKIQIDGGSMKVELDKVEIETPSHRPMLVEIKQ